MAETVSLLGYPDLSEKTYEVVKDQIIRGQLPPSSRLLVVEQAQRLGVSRTPVKDALNRLSAEGLVVRIPRKGYLVSPLDRQDVAEWMDARLMMELGAAERALERVTPPDIDRMRQLLTEMERFVDDRGAYLDYAEYLRRDCDLHLLLVSIAGNRRFTEIYKGLNVQNYIIRMYYSAQLQRRRVRTALEEHRDIVAAVESRDLPALRSAITRNIQAFIRAYEAVCSPAEDARLR